MTKRLESVDLVLFGVQHTFRFDDPVDLGIELSSDRLLAEIAAAEEVLRNVESLEVVLASEPAASASVTVSFHVEYDGEIEVELDDISELFLSDDHELTALVERGEFVEVQDGVEYDFQHNFDILDVEVEVQAVHLFDENGNDYDPE